MTALRTPLLAAVPSLAVVAAPLAAAPVPVSPAGLSAQACPTFSWSLADGAEGYELVVYGVDERGEAGAEPALSTALPAGVQSWTPSAERCLERGGAYAWSLRALDDDGAGEWSEAELFEVATAPSPDEVEAAVETLRRYLAEEHAGSGAESAQPDDGELDAGPDRHLRTGSKARVVARSAPEASSTPSLTLSDQLHLAPDSHVFKSGSVFLWDDTSANLALGRSALTVTPGSASSNTAVGFEALALNEGPGNTALGSRAGLSVDTGRYNIHIGADVVGSSSDSNTIRIGGSTGTLDGQQNRTFIAGIRDISLGLKDTEAVQIDSDGRLGTISCGSYIEAAFCPAGTDNPDGPLCSRVPPGSFCETDGECDLDAGLNNCGGADWYLRVD